MRPGVDGLVLGLERIGAETRAVSVAELTLDHLPAEVPVEEPRRDPVADDGLDGRKADPGTAPRMLGDVAHHARGHFRLEYGRDRHRVLVELAVVPIELRGVDPGQIHHADADLAPLMDELGDDRLGETADGVLRTAVCRLQRDAAVAQCRSDLYDDTPVPWPHERQRRAGAVDEAHVSD